MRPIRRGKSPFKNRSKSSLISIIGVTTRPRSQERTQRPTGANRGRFRWGRYHYPRCALCAFETPDGREPRVRTLPFYACCRRPIDAAIFVSNKLQIRCLQDGGGITTLGAGCALTNIPSPGFKAAYFAVLLRGGEECMGEKQRAFGTETRTARVSVPRRRGPAGTRCSAAVSCTAPTSFVAFMHSAALTASPAPCAARRPCPVRQVVAHRNAPRPRASGGVCRADCRSS